MGDQLPVAAPAAVTSATATERIDPTTGGVVVAGTITAAAPANPASAPTHLASAVLPAAGAYTSQAVWTFDPGTTKIDASITYTPGAVGGYAALVPWWTTPAGEVRGTVIDSTIDATAAPIGKRKLYLAEDDGPTVNDGSTIKFSVSFNVEEEEPGATAFRLLAAEAGVTATPGTCAIALSGVKQ